MTVLFPYGIKENPLGSGNSNVTVHALLLSHQAARKTVNRALMLSEKSLTVNGFAYRIHFEYQQTREQ